MFRLHIVSAYSLIRIIKTTAGGVVQAVESLSALQALNPLYGKKKKLHKGIFLTKYLLTL
jgi:hypothetical protein